MSQITRYVALLICLMSMELSLFSADLTLPIGNIIGTPTYGPANTVTSAEGEAVISGTANVTIKAGKLVLNSGFRVAQGGQLHVQLIPYFNSAPSVAVTSPGQRTLSVAPVTWIGGEANVSYRWTQISGPGTVTFVPNVSNAAKTTLATFAAAGSYVFQITATASDGSANSETLSLSIPLTGNYIELTPQTAPVMQLDSYSICNAVVKQQFGAIVSPHPVISWSTTGGRVTIIDSGPSGSNILYVSGLTEGDFIITATAGSLSASVTRRVRNSAPFILNPAKHSPVNVSDATGITATLSALADDDAPSSYLIYSWSIVGTPPAPVTFSRNGSNAAMSTIATFTKNGTYRFRVTVSDAGGLQVVSEVSVTVFVANG